MSRLFPRSQIWKQGLIFAGLLLLLSLPAGARAAPPHPSSPAACGPNWVVVPSVNPSTSENMLEGIAAAGPDEVWAVGHYYDMAQASAIPLVERWNGTAWSAVTVPMSGTQDLLYGVSLSAPGTGWAVGTWQTGSLLQTLTLRLSGGTWSVVDSPNAGPDVPNGSLQGVAAIAPNDVWAVGWYYDSAAGRNATMTLHWDGTAWRLIPSPNRESGRNELYAVSAVGPDDVWAVGHFYSPSAGHDRTLTLHWNGTAWSPVDSPDLAIDDHNRLEGVAAAGPNDVWAVGYAYVASTESTVVEHWNGSAWSIVTSPNVPQAGDSLQAVAVAAPNSVWAVGNSYKSGGENSTLVEHWNGTAWSIVPSTNVGTAENELLGVAAAAANPDDVWAVGHANDGSGTRDVTVIEHYNPCVPTCTIQFSDVPVNSTFYSYVHCLACKGVIAGYGDGTFKPQNSVTRGQMAKFIANAAGYTDAIPAGTQHFGDVPPSSPFYLFVERVYLHGIISGYSDSTFRPQNNVTRGQTAKFVANAMHYSDVVPPTQQTFIDVPPGSPFHTFVEQVYMHGIVAGYTDGTFRPNNDVTRGQASKFVANAFFPNCAVGLAPAKP